MRKTIKLSVIFLVVIMTLSLFVSCGRKGVKAQNVQTEKKVKEELNPNLELTESSWEYSPEDECVYYAVSLTNKSETEICSGAQIKVNMFTGSGQKVDSEVFGSPGIKPGETIYLGSTGMSCNYRPAEVRFKLNSTGSWQKYDGESEELISLYNCGVRNTFTDDDPGYSGEEDDLDLDFGDEFEDLELDLDDDSLTDDLEETNEKEYYGTIRNNTNNTIGSVLVCVIYRNSSGNMVSGESTSVSDIAAGETVSFTLDSCSGLARSNYQIYAYVW